MSVSLVRSLQKLQRRWRVWEAKARWGKRNYGSSADVAATASRASSGGRTASPLFIDSFLLLARALCLPRWATSIVFIAHGACSWQCGSIARSRNIPPRHPLRPSPQAESATEGGLGGRNTGDGDGSGQQYQYRQNTDPRRRVAWHWRRRSRRRSSGSWMCGAFAPCTRPGLVIAFLKSSAPSAQHEHSAGLAQRGSSVPSVGSVLRAWSVVAGAGARASRPGRPVSWNPYSEFGAGGCMGFWRRDPALLFLNPGAFPKCLPRTRRPEG